MESTPNSAPAIPEPPKTIPPVPLALLALTAWILGRALPLPLGEAPLWRLLGVLFLLAGLGAIGWVFWMMREAQTSIDVRAEPTKLLESGPFMYTRNPIYCGMIAILIALGCLALNAWFFGAAVGQYVLLDRYFIPIEERRLEAVFGAGFATYKARVRRWF